MNKQEFYIIIKLNLFRHELIAENYKQHCKIKDINNKTLEIIREYPK